MACREGLPYSPCVGTNIKLHHSKELKLVLLRHTQDSNFRETSCTLRYALILIIGPPMVVSHGEVGGGLSVPYRTPTLDKIAYTSTKSTVRFRRHAKIKFEPNEPALRPIFVECGCRTTKLSLTDINRSCATHACWTI
jgi:hypothetical protein